MSGGNRCNFCDLPDHFVRNCPDVQKYLALGKVVISADNRIMLPNGQYIPTHQAAQDAHTHGSAEAYDPPIVWANRARPMPWEKADPDRVPEVGLLGKREGVLRG